MIVGEELPLVMVVAGLTDGIKRHSQREAAKNAEAVGYLARRENSTVITVIMPLNNHAPDRSKAYFVEPWEQYRAEVKLKESGYEVVGVYHSHPSSEALPSQSDKALARPDELMVIYSVVYNDLRVWREHNGELLPAELGVTSHGRF